MVYIRTLQVDDPAAIPGAFMNADFEAFPKRPGKFLVDVTQLGMDRLWMARYSLSLPQVDVFTIKPGRKVIAFLPESGSSMRHRGMEVLSGDIIINKHDEAHQAIDGSLEIGSMSLPINELNATIEAIVGHDFMRTLAKETIRPSPSLMSRLLRLHKAVAQLAHDTPEMLELPGICNAVEKQLIHLMVRCLAEGAEIKTTNSARNHDGIIARFEDYLAARSDQPVYLTEICAGIGVAERTLRAACEQHLGMGPIRYLTLRRMHLVRRALLRADPTKTLVTRVVTDYGFWELGRFSVAYRTLFGETPSETLKRSAA